MELIICRTITKASTMDQAVKDILNNPNSPKTVIRCAATYTMQCLLGRSYDAFILAAGYFFEHAKFCEKDSLIQIAITFIDYNEDFFNKSITDQEDFSTFYKEMGHFKAIKRYSSELHETFRLSDDILPVTAKHNDNTPKIQHRARSFWYAGAFEKAMEINLELALFVLRHRNHPAILLFRLINNTGLGELDGA